METAKLRIMSLNLSGFTSVTKIQQHLDYSGGSQRKPAQGSTPVAQAAGAWSTIIPHHLKATECTGLHLYSKEAQAAGA